MSIVTSAPVPGTTLEVQAVSHHDRPKTSRLVVRNTRTTSRHDLGFTFDDYKANHYVMVATNYAERMLSGRDVPTSYLSEQVENALMDLLN